MKIIDSLKIGSIYKPAMVNGLLVTITAKITKDNRNILQGVASEGSTFEAVEPDNILFPKVN